jgi:hypothetical protein
VVDTRYRQRRCSASRSWIGRLLKRPEPAVAERFPAVEAAARANPVSGVLRLHRPTADVVVETLRGGIPLVLTGLLDAWPIGTPTALIERFGHVKLAGQRRGTSFTDFVQSALETSTVSSAGCTLPEAMWSAFPFPCSTPRATRRGSCGPAPPGSIARLPNCTEIFSMPSSATSSGASGCGSSRPTSEIGCTRPKATTPISPVAQSQATPTFRVFPRLADAVPLEIVLSPGELLVIPIGWFHQVFADDPVFSVSAFLKFEAWQALATPA